MAIVNSDILEIAQESIDSKRPEFVELESFSLQATTNRVDIEEGDGVKVGIYQTNVASDFNADTNNYETEDGGGLVYKTIPMEKHHKSTFKIKAQTTRFDMVKMMDAATVAVAKKNNTYVYNLILAAAYANDYTAGAASTFDHEAVADLWQLSQDGEFGDKKSMILTNPYYAALLKDPNLAEFDKANTDETLRDAVVRRLYDFETMSSNTLAASTGATGENLVGFITDQAAIAVGTALPAIQDEESTSRNSIIETIQGPNGLAMQFRKHTDPATGIVWGSVENVIGAAVMDETRLTRIKSA